ncbi:50S ribosomal protein L21e [Candidatus Micrarchaeota archaeon]|nr:50S ribosomal protein L21e [Candidatus Micrarchaeota archaeon]
MVRHKKRAFRSKTRKRFRKDQDERRMDSVNVMMQQFAVGDRVHVHVNPSIHSAMPFRRFDGKTGVVLGSQGGCFRVRIPDMRAEKEIIVHPAHLRPAQ